MVAKHTEISPEAFWIGLFIIGFAIYFLLAWIDSRRYYTGPAKKVTIDCNLSGWQGHPACTGDYDYESDISDSYYQNIVR